MTLVNKILYCTITPAGDYCFNLLIYILLEALLSYLLAKDQSLAGPLQAESFKGGLLSVSSCKNRGSCSPKAADTS